MSNPNFTPFTEPEVVAEYLSPVIERLRKAFTTACSRTSRTFAKRKWSDDAALSAFMVRKEVIENLRGQGMQVEEEDVEVEKKALCGMLLTLSAVQLKIRKSKDGEIPAAGSQQSLSFYNWNLLAFPQQESDKVVPLHLLLLWNDNRKGELDTLLLVCVEGSEWRWRVPVFQQEERYTTQRVQLNPEAKSASVEPSEAAAFTTTFDAGNENVPMKLLQAEPVANEPAPNKATASAPEEEPGQELKKEA